MGATVATAIQVLITAQVFLLGLAANQYQTAVVGRLRGDLDELHALLTREARSQGSPSDFVERVERATSILGADLVRFGQARSGGGLKSQLLLSMLVVLLVAGLMWSADTYWQPEDSGRPGWPGAAAILLAALFGPISVGVQVLVARSTIFRSRDRVLVTCLDQPDAAIVVASNIAPVKDREELDKSLRLTDIKEMYRSSGDPRSGSITARIVRNAAVRAYGDGSEQARKALIFESATLAEYGAAAEALEVAKEAADLGDAKIHGSLELLSARNLAERLTESDPKRRAEARAYLSDQIAACSEVDEMHPSKLAARISLAFLADEAHLHDAITQVARDVEVLSRAGAPPDPPLVRTRLNLAELNLRAGDTAKAVRELEDLTALTQKAYGRDHMLAIEARIALALATIVRGDPRGLDLLRHATDAARSNLGMDHKITLEATVLLAEAETLRRSKMDATDVLEFQALKARCAKTLGEEHSLTLRAATLVQDADELSRALDSQDEALSHRPEGPMPG